MIIDIPNGVWPTMITPFTDNNCIDYNALEAMVEWYIENGSDGLFAVCQSSEMFYLTLEERTSIIEFVKKTSKGRVPVIASGHVSDTISDQVIDVIKASEAGADAVVLLTNKFGLENATDELWFNNLLHFLNYIPKDIPLGFYECPYPYKKVLSPELFEKCNETGRFKFLKDTSCDLDNISKKLNAVKGSGLKIYNANSATLLESLKMGVAGYSGVMANFHPDLYKWLCANWKSEPEKARILSDFLGVASLIEKQWYPVNAKYHMQLAGIPIKMNTRSKDVNSFSKSNQIETLQLYALTDFIRNTYI